MYLLFQICYIYLVSNQPTFHFPNKRHLHYVQYLGQIPQLNAFTICAWLSPNSNSSHVKGVVVSYCDDAATERCNDLMVTIMANGTKLYIHINETQKNINIDRLKYRTHLCVAMSEENGDVRVYFNATLNHNSIPLWSGIKGRGVLILGQDQDRDKNGLPGKPKHEKQGFYGEIANFSMWNRSLSISEIKSVHNSSCYPLTGMIVSFNSSNFLIEGDIRNGTLG